MLRPTHLATIRRLLIASFVAVSLAACGQEDAETPSPNSAASATQGVAQITDQDPLTRRVVAAMCGTPKERALAISALAEPARSGDDESDDIYWIADGVVKQGCPAPKGR